MLRINQLAKELGVSNHEVINILEKNLGIHGKSHSSNLSDDQVNLLRLAIVNKINPKGALSPSVHLPLNKDKVNASSIKVVKPGLQPSTKLSNQRAVLIKKNENQAVDVISTDNQITNDSSKASTSSVSTEQASQSTESIKTVLGRPQLQKEGFSHLRISTAPVMASKPKEPARYIQLPQPQAKSRPETGARPHKASGQRSQSSQQAGKTLLPMATNTGKGHVRREQVGQNKNQQPPTAQPQQPQAQPIHSKRRPFIPPSSAELRSDSGFTRIKMSDTPTPAPRNLEPARYIQLPQQKQQQQPRRPASTRSSGPSARPGSSRPTSARSSNGLRQGGVGSGTTSRHGSGGIISNIPPDLSVHKGPGRGGHFAGKKKDDKRTRAEKIAEELELKLRQPRSRAQQVATEYVENEIGIVMLSEGVSVKELAEKCNRPAKDVVAKLLHRGILATINQPLDTELAKEIAREFGYLADIVTFEEDVQIAAEESGEAVGEKLWRPPVVTIMGHVDHGKTSLLDAIRTSKITESEAGGITQAIGAYHVDIKNDDEPDRKIVFIDTPGHKAFTKMRARGAKVTDIVILVVAADDGVMPQTIEAINHAKAADVPMVVAINKIDKPGANPDKIEQELLQYGVQTELYGGDVPCVHVSAKTKEGLDTLLETVLLVADLRDLKAVYDCPAAGIIIEAKLDRGRGPVAAVIIQHGTVRIGDIFVSGATMGRVRAMFSDRLEKVTEATPSMAVQILGFEEVPVAGDKFQVMESETKARAVVSFRQEKAGTAAQAKQRVTLENIFSGMKDDQSKELPLIIKCNTQGSVESLVSSLEQLSTEKAKVRIVHAAAGTVTENDILLAEASKASIIAFGVKVERKISELAHENNIDIRSHDTIYKVTEEISSAMIGLLDIIKKETIQGLVEVRQIFKVNKSVIAGSFVVEGKVRNDYMVHVKRGNDVIWNGKIRTLKRFKDDVTEVKSGLDCGIELDGFTSVKEGDCIEFYTLEKIADTSL